MLLFFVDIQIIRYRTDTPLWAVGYRPRSAPLNARPSDGPHSIFVWKIGSGAIIERITNCAPSTSNAHNAGKMPNMQIADVFSIGIRSGTWHVCRKTKRIEWCHLWILKASISEVFSFEKNLKCLLGFREQLQITAIINRDKLPGERAPIGEKSTNLRD